MAGLKVVVVRCDAEGNVDLADLKAKAAAHRDELAALMVTYPSTHGVFEEAIGEIKRHCEAAGVPLGIFAVDAQYASDAIASGFKLIALSMDSFFLWKSAKAALEEVRGESYAES